MSIFLQNSLLFQIKKVGNTIKVAVLVAIWILFTAVLMSRDEKELAFQPISVPPAGEHKSNEKHTIFKKRLQVIILIFLCFVGYDLHELPLEPRIGIYVSGAFADTISNSTNFLFIRPKLLRILNDSGGVTLNTESIGDIFKLPIVENVNNIDRTLQVERAHTFNITTELLEQIKQNGTKLQLDITSNLQISFPINLAYDSTPIDKSRGVIYAGVILFCLYIMIITEIVDRIFAGMIASTFAIATLGKHIFINKCRLHT